MVRLKITLQYDGQAYYGWQIQEGLPSVQGALAHALEQLVEHDVKLVGAGRTDRGVHAWGQVAHADVAKDLTDFKFITGMNRFLPKDIRVVAVEHVGEDFHARFSATARHYVYRLWNARVMRPDLRGHAGHVPLPLDIEAIQAAVQTLPPGEYDFKGFQDAECNSRVSLCDLHHLRWVKESLGDSGNLWRLEIGANHFLQHMVRNIMGTLIEIGQGKRPTTGLLDVLAAQNRAQAGLTFTPDGLYLSRVVYTPEL